MKTNNVINDYKPRNAFYARTNSLINKVLRIDFKKVVEWDGEGFTFDGKKLISPSRLNRAINDLKFKDIPKYAITKAQERGTRLMENLLYWFQNKCDFSEIPTLDENEKKYLISVFNWLIDNHFEVLSVEKFIHNGVYCGYIDMIVKKDYVNYILEIKTRGDNVIYKTDYIQTYIYSKMLNSAPIILLIIDKNYEAHHHFIDMKYAIRPYWKTLRNFLKFFDYELPSVSTIRVK